MCVCINYLARFEHGYSKTSILVQESSKPIVIVESSQASQCLLLNATHRFSVHYLLGLFMINNIFYYETL